MEASSKDFDSTRSEQDRFTSNMRALDSVWDRRLFSEWPQLASRVGLTKPARITPNLDEPELERLRRENKQLLSERDELRRSREDTFD